MKNENSYLMFNGWSFTNDNSVFAEKTKDTLHAEICCTEDNNYLLSLSDSYNNSNNVLLEVDKSNPVALSRLMHYADMWLTDSDWREQSKEVNLIDSYCMEVADSVEFVDEEVSLPETLSEESQLDFGEDRPGLYSEPKPPKDPLDYEFGESVCNVLTRWSRELKKMRDWITD